MNGGDSVRSALLEVRDLTKSFDGVTVLDGVDLDVYGGEIHAIVGANGSGKSTLVKILSGYHRPSRGSFQTAEGHLSEVPAMTFVHQDLGLVDSMTVLENVALLCGYTTRPGGSISWKAMRAEIGTVLAEYGISVRPNAVVGNLGATDRRLVAIARAVHGLRGQRGVLVLDEPTAELGPSDAKRVYDTMSLVANNAGVLFISHDLADALALAHTVTVLRDGRVAANVRSETTSVNELVDYMFGSETSRVLKDLQREDHDRKDTKSQGEADRVADGVPVLRLNGLSSSRLNDVTLDVWPGEVVGITGLVASGKSELGRVIAGAQTVTTGSISIAGASPTTFASPHAAYSAGVVYVPADRRRFGGIMSMTARENVTLSTVRHFFKNGWLRKRQELRAVATEMGRVGAQPPRPEQVFGAFSGGNQQKLIFARALRAAPKVAVFDEPTHGVDVATIPELYRLVTEMSLSGRGVVVITSDFDELVALCNRVIVLRYGRVAQELQGEDVNVGTIARAVG